MIKILHNPRCAKSREGLMHLEDKGLEVEIIRYLDDPLTPDELTEVLRKLNQRPLDIIRTKEDLFKEDYQDKEMSDEEWILAMVENPQLIERPIVINGEKAVLARPANRIDDIL